MLYKFSYKLLIPSPINASTIRNFKISSEKQVGTASYINYVERETQFCSRNFGISVEWLIGDGITTDYKILTAL
jgi:hypothetical protein